MLTAPANDNSARSSSSYFTAVLLAAWLLDVAIMAARYTWWAA